MTEEAAHAKLSPSGAEKIIACPGSLAMEEDYPDTSSKFADEGTAAHTLASWVLEGNHPSTEAFLGRRIEVSPSYTHEVDKEMCEEVQKYVDFVRGCATNGMTLLVEQKVNFSRSIGVDDALAWGTSDAILVGEGRVIIGDLKYGRGVRVMAADNKQMKTYALGVLDTFDMVFDFKDTDQVTLFIHQPRLNHVDVWPAAGDPPVTVADIRAFAKEWATAAIDVAAAFRAKAGGYKTVKMEAYLHPTTKGCMWCKAKANCPALQDFVQETVGMQFEDLTAGNTADPRFVVAEMGDNSLPAAMAAIDLIEDFCTAVRAEVERRLLGGRKVNGYKLVEGKRGNRAWTDEKAAEKLLKESFRLPQDDIYTKKLITAPAAVKLLKGSEKRLEKVQALIGQADGKPSVAPVDDPRKEWTPMAFEDVSTTEASFA